MYEGIPRPEESLLPKQSCGTRVSQGLREQLDLFYGATGACLLPEPCIPAAASGAGCSAMIPETKETRSPVTPPGSMALSAAASILAQSLAEADAVTSVAKNPTSAILELPAIIGPESTAAGASLSLGDAKAQTKEVQTDASMLSHGAVKRTGNEFGTTAEEANRIGHWGIQALRQRELKTA